MKRTLLLFLIIFSLLFTACGGKPTVFSSEGESWTMGFASMEILPPNEPLNIAGYNQGVKITGVLDYQRASAVWMDTGGDGVLLIGVDCVGLSSGTVAKIRKCIDLDAKVFVYSTHTHAGIDTLGLWGGIGVDGKNEAFQNRLIDAAVAAAEMAYENRTAGKLYYGKVPTENMYRDSRDPQVYDENMYILRFAPESGSGFRIVNYAAHAESLRGDNTLVSRDFPGVMAGIIKERTGDDMLVIPGAIGGLIMTRVLCEGEFDAQENLRLTGEALAEYALSDYREEELPPRLLTASTKFDVPLDNTVFLLYRFLGILDNPARPGDGETGYTLTSEMALLKLGSVTFALIPGEIFPELVYGGYFPESIELNPAPLGETAAKFGVKTLLIAGLANDEIGYIVPPNNFLLHEIAPYITTPEDDARGENHYEETNSAGYRTAHCIAAAFESLLQAAFGEPPR